MHLPTYLTLMSLGALYAVFHSIMLWSSNQLLFWIGIFVAVLNVMHAIAQSCDPDEIQFKWMLIYIVPFLLLVLASFSGYQEIKITALAKLGIAIPSALPGKSSDYEAAVWSHYGSMAFPMLAAGAANIVQAFRR